MRVDNREAEHERLLVLASRVDAEARANDREALIATTNRLLNALAMHLDDERNETRRLDDAAREAKTRGEQQVVEQFVNLAREATRTSSGTCRCEHIASKALRQLRQQIVAEAPAGDRK
jgi:hypothetical protein